MSGALSLMSISISSGLSRTNMPPSWRNHIFCYVSVMELSTGWGLDNFCVGEIMGGVYHQVLDRF
jgi:hypothetical protein